MARPEELYPGNCYFMVNFHDRKLLFPAIYTYRYVECEEEDGSRSWVFEDPPDLNAREDSSEEESGLTVFSDDQLYEILDFPGLVRVIEEVAADHPLHALPGPITRPN